MVELPISDEYFNRSARVVEGTPRADARVRYAVFARNAGVLCGANHAVAFIDKHCTGSLTIRGRRDGDAFAAREAVLIIEGAFGRLVNLETTYLGMLAFSGAATNMHRITKAAGHVPVVDMAARHYPYEIIEQTAYAAAIGGAAGTSTQAGHRYVHRWLGVGDGQHIRVGDGPRRPFGLYGSIPHALNAVFAGDSVESAAAYQKRLPQVPLTVLLDFEGRELDVCRDAYRRFGDKLFAVRIDTGGSRVHQGGHERVTGELEQLVRSKAGWSDVISEALDRYGAGPGVTIEAAFNVRRALDEVGATKTQIVVSSGFSAEKVAAFVACGAPMDAIGTGSWVSFEMFTSDITHVLSDGQWVSCCKAGRGEELVLDSPETATLVCR